MHKSEPGRPSTSRAHLLVNHLTAAYHNKLQFPPESHQQTQQQQKQPRTLSSHSNTTHQSSSINSTTTRTALNIKKKQQPIDAVLSSLSATSLTAGTTRLTTATTIGTSQQVQHSAQSTAYSLPYSHKRFDEFQFQQKQQSPQITRSYNTSQNHITSKQLQEQQQQLRKHQQYPQPQPHLQHHQPGAHTIYPLKSSREIDASFASQQTTSMASNGFSFTDSQNHQSQLLSNAAIVLRSVPSKAKYSAILESRVPANKQQFVSALLEAAKECLRTHSVLLAHSIARYAFKAAMTINETSLATQAVTTLLGVAQEMISTSSTNNMNDNVSNSNQSNSSSNNNNNDSASLAATILRSANKFEINHPNKDLRYLIDAFNSNAADQTDQCFSDAINNSGQSMHSWRSSSQKQLRHFTQNPRVEQHNTSSPFYEQHQHPPIGLSSVPMDSSVLMSHDQLANTAQLMNVIECQERLNQIPMESSNSVIFSVSAGQFSPRSRDLSMHSVKSGASAASSKTSRTYTSNKYQYMSQGSFGGSTLRVVRGNKDDRDEQLKLSSAPEFPPIINIASAAASVAATDELIKRNILLEALREDLLSEIEKLKRSNAYLKVQLASKSLNHSSGIEAPPVILLQQPKRNSSSGSSSSNSKNVTIDSAVQTETTNRGIDKIGEYIERLERENALLKQEISQLTTSMQLTIEQLKSENARLSVQKATEGDNAQRIDAKQSNQISKWEDQLKLECNFDSESEDYSFRGDFFQNNPGKTDILNHAYRNGLDGGQQVLSFGRRSIENASGLVSNQKIDVSFEYEVKNQMLNLKPHSQGILGFSVSLKLDAVQIWIVQHHVKIYLKVGLAIIMDGKVIAIQGKHIKRLRSSVKRFLLKRRIDSSSISVEFRGQILQGFLTIFKCMKQSIVYIRTTGYRTFKVFYAIPFTRISFEDLCINKQDLIVGKCRFSYSNGISWKEEENEEEEFNEIRAISTQNKLLSKGLKTISRMELFTIQGKFRNNTINSTDQEILSENSSDCIEIEVVQESDHSIRLQSKWDLPILPYDKQLSSSTLGYIQFKEESIQLIRRARLEVGVEYGKKKLMWCEGSEESEDERRASNSTSMSQVPSDIFQLHVLRMMYEQDSRIKVGIHDREKEKEDQILERIEVPNHSTKGVCELIVTHNHTTREYVIRSDQLKSIHQIRVPVANNGARNSSDSEKSVRRLFNYFFYVEKNEIRIVKRSTVVKAIGQLRRFILANRFGYFKLRISSLSVQFSEQNNVVASELISFRGQKHTLIIVRLAVGEKNSQNKSNLIRKLYLVRNQWDCSLEQINSLIANSFPNLRVTKCLRVLTSKSIENQFFEFSRVSALWDAETSTLVLQADDPSIPIVEIQRNDLIGVDQTALLSAAEEIFFKVVLFYDKKLGVNKIDV